jgi:hypothetical protein
MLGLKPFYSTMGIEFTYLVPESVSKESPTSELTEAFVALVENKTRDWPKPFRPHSITNDDRAVEISSPILKSPDQLAQFWDYLSAVTKEFGLVTHRDDSSSGGGHIHVGIPKKYLRDPLQLAYFLTTVFRAVGNRPWMNWLFNEWNDRTSANHFSVKTRLMTAPISPTSYPRPTAGGVRPRRRYRRPATSLFLDFDDFSNKSSRIFSQLMTAKEPVLPLGSSVEDVLYIFDIVKGCSCRVDAELKTIEFRFFDAKRNWEEVVLHVNFLTSFMEWIEVVIVQNLNLIPLTVMTPHDLAESAKIALPEFRKGLAAFNLSYEDYSRFVKLNFSPRKRHGVFV